MVCLFVCLFVCSFGYLDPCGLHLQHCLWSSFLEQFEALCPLAQRLVFGASFILKQIHCVWRVKKERQANYVQIYPDKDTSLFVGAIWSEVPCPANQNQEKSPETFASVVNISNEFGNQNLVIINKPSTRSLHSLLDPCFVLLSRDLDVRKGSWAFYLITHKSTKSEERLLYR